MNIKSFLEKKFPHLKPIKGHCDHCNHELIADIPFVEKDFCIGYQSNPCICGKGTHTPKTFTLIKKQDIIDWKNLIN